MNSTEEFPFVHVKRALLRYHGGKFRLAPWVIEHFPRHRTYVEVFGGAAGVLLRKERSQVEVYNDLDSQVFGFFKILRSPEHLSQLLHLLELTPFSREEFDLTYEYSADPIEAARRFVSRCFFGHGTCSIDVDDSNGFRSCDIRAGKSYAREWAKVPSAIATAAARLQGVTIENLDFRKLIPKLDHPDTLFYVDPPYLMETRSAGGKGYTHEMTQEDHCQLAWLLARCKARIVISGYPSELYTDLFQDWRRDEKRVSANGQRGAVSRLECLWMNFPAA